MMEPHGTEAVGYPGLFRGFLINTELDYKGKGPRCKPESSRSRQHICTTLFPWETVLSSKKVIHITIDCVVRDSVLESRFIN